MTIFSCEVCYGRVHFKLMVGLGIPFNSIRVVRSSARVDRGMMYGINRGGGGTKVGSGVGKSYRAIFRAICDGG